MDSIPGLPRAFPNAEWRSIEDVFRPPPIEAFTGTGAAGSPEVQWVTQELEYYVANYTKTEDLHVCLVSFNVAAKRPPSNFSSLFSTTSADGSNRPVDLFVFAFQEIDMSARAMMMNETDAATPWVQSVAAALNADSNLSANHSSPYCLLPSKQLVGLLLVTCLRRELLPHLSERSIATVTTGAMNTMGNKGAVGMHLVLHRTSLCLLCVHLAAGQDHVAKRNEDANSILKSMDFNAAQRAEMRLNTNAGVFAQALFSELFPRSHDVIVVAGDLNYRLNLSYEQAVALADKGAIEELLRYDQLTAEMRNPHTPWQGFVAFPPRFLPTYRYDVGTNTYDTSSKKRIPSYTDRVLVWSKRRSREALIALDEFTAVSEVCSSDHKPVRAMMRLPLCVEVPEEKQRVTAQLRAKVQSLGLSKASCSQTAVDNSSLDFGLQQFHQCGTALTVSVSNTGECVAVVRVLRQRAQDDSEGAWLRVSPSDFAILPGETQTVTVETKIDPACMPWLGRWHPYDGRARLVLLSTLLFCVRNGPLHAVTCKAVLKPSVFGNSLENIYLLGQEPCERAYSLKGDIPSLLRSLQAQVPKELWYLADCIYRHPFESGLFTASDEEGDTDAARKAIMAHLDSADGPLPEGTSARCAAECLLIFLQSLQESIVPTPLYTAALAAGRAKGRAPFDFLSQVPALHATVWVYVMGLLNFLLRRPHCDSNELTPTILAEVFSRVLLSRPAELQQQALLLQGGAVDQRKRQQLREEADDAKSLVECFLIATPPVLHSP